MFEYRDRFLKIDGVSWSIFHDLPCGSLLMGYLGKLREGGWAILDDRGVSLLNSWMTSSKMAIKLTAKPWQMMRPFCRHLQSSTLIALWSIVKIKLRLLHPTNNLMSKMMSSPSLSTSSVKWETITRLKWHNSPKRCKRLKRSTTT